VDASKTNIILISFSILNFLIFCYFLASITALVPAYMISVFGNLILTTEDKRRCSI
jgi:hypothetical protein